MKTVFKLLLLCIFSLFTLHIDVQADTSGLNNRNVRKLARARPGKVKAKAFNKVCKKVSPLRGALLKNTAGGHIGSSDPRYTGFAFICGSDCAKSFPVNAYYSDGTLAFKLGYYGRWSGNGKPRAYCAVGGAPRCYVSTVKRDSRRKGRDGKVYLHFGSKSCRSATPGQRNDSGF